MRLRSIVFTGVFTGLVGVVLLAAPLARADDPYTVSVINYEKIPAGTTYVTDLNENTELTSNAEGALKKALANRGLDYDTNGRLGFVIGTPRLASARTPDAVFDTTNTILHLNLNSGDIK